MHWTDIAQGWLERLATTPNGERATARQDYLADKGISPDTLHRYVRAFGFLDQVRLALAPLCTKEADRSAGDIVSTLSALDIDHLHHLHRHSEPTFIAALTAVVGGQRGNHLKEHWAEIKRGDAILGNQPRNANGFRSQGRLSRPAALRKAVECCGLFDPKLVILDHAQLLAPFAADAVVLQPEQPSRCIGFRFLGTSGSPGHEARLLEAVASALAAARGFHEIYIVAQHGDDAARLASKVYAVGPCGVGVIACELAENARVVSPARRRQAKQQPDLRQVLLQTLLAKRLIAPLPARR